MEMEKEKRHVGLVTGGVLMGLVLSALDQTIVSTAMPTITKELGGLSLYSWVFAIYMLTSTTSMPIYGKMADLFGARKMYLIGLFVFLVGSLLCGMANSMTGLIVARGVQGLGAGALMPVAFIIVGELYPPEKRGKFQGLFGAVFAMTSIFGPSLGGMIVEHLPWGWIFFINLPIGIAAFLIIALAFRDQRHYDKKPVIDWYGTTSLSAAIILILLSLVMEGREYKIGLGGAGTLFLCLFIWIETKAKEPLLPLSLFRIPVICYGNLVGFFVSAALFGAIAYIPLFVQGVRDASPSEAGFLLVPLMLSAAISSTIGGRWMTKASFRAILIPSLLIMATGFFLLSTMDEETTNVQLVIYMIVTGLGMGAIYPALGTAAQSAVKPEDRGVAMSTSQLFRSIGGTIGVSVFGSIVEWRMRAGLVFSEALHDVFITGLILIGISLIASVRLGNTRLLDKEPRHSHSTNSGVPKQ
ncbi:MDR family MFS transporter [Brevibacillus brevis]|uniref:MDR family MFS transporter n=1 Tax=Brevibacillus brevis TaxID=1393 RepID=UPI0025A548AD|nr:MDR family MFS transporter [Brevibacillus brevis]WJQ83754.1 MDR family MFS transporter [Brevibacillus brevis]